MLIFAPCCQVSKKRPAVTITPKDSKKQKTTDASSSAAAGEATESAVDAAQRKAKKKLQKLSRKSLESLFLQNVATIIASTSEIGALRRQV